MATQVEARCKHSADTAQACVCLVGFNYSCNAKVTTQHNRFVLQSRRDETRTSGGVFIGSGLRSAAGSLTLARRPSDARTPMRSGRIIRT